MVREKIAVYIEAVFGGEKKNGTGLLLKCIDSNNQPKNIIISCFHVIGGEKKSSQKAKIWYYDSGYHPSTAKIVKIQKIKLEGVPEDAKDLVILELEEDVNIEGVANYTDTTCGSEVVAYGYPLGKDSLIELKNGKVIPTIYSFNVQSIIENDSIYLLSGDSIGGISGSPVFYENKLLGIFRGRNTKYNQAVVIGHHWIQTLCAKTGYTLPQSDIEEQSIQDYKSYQQIRDKIAECFQQKKSVNLFTPPSVEWDELFEHIKKDHPNLGIVDLENPKTQNRKGLVTQIAESYCKNKEFNIPEKPFDLSTLAEIIDKSETTWLLALLRFHYVSERKEEYEFDLFSSLRHWIQKKKIVLLVQSRRPFIELVPKNNYLSYIDIYPLEFKGE